MTKFKLFLLTHLFLVSAYAQNYTQTLKGTVTDKALGTPLRGVTVSIDIDSSRYATTDSNGYYEFRNVPVGRIRITAVYSAYSDVSIPNLLLTSGKELVVNMQMEESVTNIGTMRAKAKVNKQKPLNDMSNVSARTFSVEETQRFAAAVNDPARMATSFAGVVGADDGNNTIVIRGNAPSGMLWRMEGIDIPGPNHFASFNAASGGISILSAQLLANSDFVTGAFAAEYGNALSGVFDLKLRKGNSKKREYTLQAGVLGVDLATEGPLSKKGGSYLVNYRYSTLGILQKFGIDITGSATKFQDLSFNVALPKYKFGSITFFGFGGISTQAQLAKKDSSQWIVRSDRYNMYYGSNTGAMGMTHLISLSPRTSLKNIVLLSGTMTYDKGDFYKDDYIHTYMHWKNSISNSKISLHSVLNHKISKAIHLRTGIILNHWMYNTKQTQLDTLDVLRTYLNLAGQTNYIQAYAQTKIRASRKLTLFAGFHSMFLELNNRYSIEPRLSARYDFRTNQAFTFGYGLHSQLQQPGVYFAQTTGANGETIYPNKNLNFNKANHYVLGYELSINSSNRIKIETYYQKLFNIAVGATPGSTFSVLNQNGALISDPLVNKGIAENYGIELTVERFLSKGFYYLLSGSLYNSRYQAQTRQWYNGRYNSQHALTFTAGKEIKLRGDKKLLGLNIKTIWYGGFWQTPIDLEKSRLYHWEVTDDTRPYSIKLPDYFRTDFKISYRINHARYNSIWSLDLQNATNHKNVGGTYFDLDKEETRTWYQAPLIPVFSYKVEF